MKTIIYILGIALSLLMLHCSGANKAVLSSGGAACMTPSFADYNGVPYNMESYFEYDEGLFCSRLQSKPNLIYFSGFGSRESRMFEDKIWSDEKNRRIMEKKYVLTTLFVDSKMDLPSNYWIVSEITGDTLKTDGKKNTYYQKTQFKNDSIPAFYIINSKEEILLGPYYYDESPGAFKRFLNKGVARYKKQ